MSVPLHSVPNSNGSCVYAIINAQYDYKHTFCKQHIHFLTHRMRHRVLLHVVYKYTVSCAYKTCSCKEFQLTDNMLVWALNGDALWRPMWFIKDERNVKEGMEFGGDAESSRGTCIRADTRDFYSQKINNSNPSSTKSTSVTFVYRNNVMARDSVWRELWRFCHARKIREAFVAIHKEQK